MSLMSFTFYRYVGTGLEVQDIKIQNRDIVALQTMSSDLHLMLLPSMAHALQIDVGQAEAIRSSSRAFHADPAKLFKNFKGLEDVAKKPKPASDVQPSFTSDDVRHNPSDPAPTMPVHETKGSDPGILDTEGVKFGTRQFNIPEYKGLNPLEYVKGAALGGSSIQDYKVIKLAPSGTAHISLKTARDMKGKAARIYDDTAQVPDHILADFVDNIIPAIGSKVDLPFNRLYLSVGNKEDTHIVTSTTGGIMYGKIHISPSQLHALYGGFNSRVVAQAVTHELAHFYDNTIMRNFDKLKFKNSVQGVSIHPLATTGAALTARKEHFATLAELMVWGSAARGVYCLNGVEIVEKYFENRYITDKDKLERIF